MSRLGRLHPVPCPHCLGLGIRSIRIIVGATSQELGVDCGKVGDVIPPYWLIGM